MSGSNGTHGTHANWDMTPYFPTFDGPEYRAHRDNLEKDLKAAGAAATALGPITTANTDAWAKHLLRIEQLMVEFNHIGSYIGCLGADDANNEGYKREQARLSLVGAEFSKAMVPVAAAFRAVDDAAFEKLASHPDLASARHHLEQERKDAKFTMAPELEILNADLSVDGISAWGRLYNTVAGNLSFEMRWPDGRNEQVPMAQKRALLEDGDPAVRKAALVGSNAAWEKVAEPVAACLNGIGGTRLTLNRHRGIKHFLDVAMFQSSVKEETIEQMWSVIAKNRELPWRYLRLKAEMLGMKKLGFQDLSAPLPLKDSRAFTWSEGVEMTLNAFGASYPALAKYSKHMLDNRQVESEKRKGKRPGAFCSSSKKIKQSRVFMTYGGTIGDIQTLAHEIGHAFHNETMKDMRAYQRSYPMTLAETASTFAEDILCRSVIRGKDTPDQLRAQLLNTLLDHAATFMLDIHMRYIFEKAFYTERAKGEVSIPRLKELMLDAQRETFGDVLDPEQMDPWFWASKLHFYITGVTFYNFPYTFGYFFSRGLSARFAAEGPSFLKKYEDLLRLTGSDTAEGVAQRSIGVDLTKPDFWAEAVGSLAEDIALFEKVVPDVLAANA